MLTYKESFKIESAVSAQQLKNSNSSENIDSIMKKINKFIEKMPIYESEPRKFINEFVVLIRSANKDIGAKSIFAEIVDHQYRGALNKVKDKYELDSSELEILCMLALGMSNNAIRIIMDHANNRTIYNYRSSLKSKLNISMDTISIVELFLSEKL